MIFRLDCGDVTTGCSARFESTDRDELLTMAARHAADAHGFNPLTPEFIDAVTAHVVVEDDEDEAP